MAALKRRVLIIAYQFPPVGGAGVQRVAKFARYLPEHGWDVSVLTVANPSVPLVDGSLMEEIPAETIVRRAKSLEPGYGWKQAVVQSAGTELSWRTRIRRSMRAVATTLLQPDPQILWVPQAIRAGMRLLREVPHHAILVSGPPFSSFLVAAALRRWSGLPLVLDYRDEWTISNRYRENLSRNRLANWVSRRLEASVLRRADAVLATTQHSAQTLAQEASAAGKQIPVQCLYNGYDPDDLPPAEANQTRDPQRYRLAHVGTLWNLTTVRTLVEAVERLTAARPELAARLDIEIVGRCMPAEVALLERLRNLPCNLIERGYADHRTAVQVMRHADELCLLLADVPGAERVVPGKTFEYLATGREILAIAPEGEAQDVLKGFAGVNAFSPRDVAGISEHLARRLAALDRTEHVRQMGRFDRRQQSGQLATLLNEISAETRACELTAQCFAA